ncbi:MAG: NAD-dependent epimerase/dehydratase family protein [Alphaproteobacteria bacterium]|nr:NAD-dependent epimerase/dehydratase family protein [Alphaproteobacteria bacterium]
MGPERRGELMAMRILVLGGTGYIGAAVVAEFKAHGHAVVALARSAAAATRLERQGCTIVRGDMRQPAAWLPRVGAVGAVVHTAATFDSEMAAADRRLVDSLLEHFGRGAPGPRILYTGGVWLYGADGAEVINETSPFEPLRDFAWMVEHRNLLVASAGVDAVIVHPAMVYDRDGGVISMFLEDARAGGPIRIVGTEGVRWPMVHRDDLAVLYRLALERGRAGHDYLGVAEPAVAVVDIARSIAGRFGLTNDVAVRSTAEFVREKGGWAAGYALDQQVSGAKAQGELGWRPRRRDILREVGAAEAPG